MLKTHLQLIKLLNKDTFNLVYSSYSDLAISYSGMEFKEFEPRFKSAKIRFKLSAGFNLNRRSNSFFLTGLYKDIFTSIQQDYFSIKVLISNNLF